MNVRNARIFKEDGQLIEYGFPTKLLLHKNGRCLDEFFILKLLVNIKILDVVVVITL